MLQLGLITALVVAAAAYKWYTENKIKKVRYSLPPELTNSYNKLTLPISELTVLDRNYTDQVDDNSYSDIAIADALYDPERNVRHVEKWVSVLVYEPYLFRGKSYRLNSISIDMDKKMLSDRLRRELTSIDVYIDPQDPRNHYFDLSFLHVR